ncbi:MAG: hypothetical protein IBX55_21455 [Methyloprofundus sp.]|nr:hypothetical protein [Methyloprofundus sp.]
MISVFLNKKYFYFVIFIIMFALPLVFTGVVVWIDLPNLVNEKYYLLNFACGLLVIFFFFFFELDKNALNKLWSNLVLRFLVALYILMMVYLLLFYIVGPFNSNGLIFSQTFFLIYYSLINLLLFVAFFKYFYFRESKSKLFFLLFFMLFFVAATMFLNIKYSGGMLFNVNDYLDQDYFLNYQLISFYALLIWFVIYYFINSFFVKYFSIVLVMVILFLSGGRTELFAFILVFLGVLLMKTFVHRSGIKIFLSTIFSIIVLLFITSFYFDFNELFKTRHFVGLMNIFNSDSVVTDNSLDARDNILVNNLLLIDKNVLLGNYGSHFSSGSVGGYIHNLLSAWQQFGLLGFILLFFLIAYPFYFFLMKYLSCRACNYYEPLFFIASYVLLVMLFTKSVFWVYWVLSPAAYFSYILYSSKTRVKI